MQADAGSSRQHLLECVVEKGRPDAVPAEALCNEEALELESHLLRHARRLVSVHLQAFRRPSCTAATAEQGSHLRGISGMVLVKDRLQGNHANDPHTTARAHARNTTIPYCGVSHPDAGLETCLTLSP